MTARPAKTEVVRLGDLTDVAAAVPYALGFHPSNSLVAVALCGPRERMSFTMRHDLLDPVHDDEVAQMCAERMAQAKARAVLLLIYAPPPPPAPGELPRAELVAAVARALPMELRDALLVADGRVWSYVCDDGRCCPPEGRALRPDSGGALRLAAAHALHGTAVLPDRDALVATTAAVGGITAESMRQAVDRAFAELARDDDDDDDDADRLTSSFALVDRLCARYADPPASLSHDEAAMLMLRVHHVHVRDDLITRIARGDDSAAWLVGDLARLAQPPYDAPAAAMLGMAGYFRGDGVVSVAAAERALATDPGYSLAQLLLECVGRQLDPKHVRRVWARHGRQGR